MKWLLLIIAITACGAAGYKKDKRKPVSEPCTVSEVDGGVLIVCPDGSHAFLPNGQDGSNGLPGESGQDGKDGKDAPVCAITEIVYQCSDGSIRVFK